VGVAEMALFISSSNLSAFDGGHWPEQSAQIVGDPTAVDIVTNENEVSCKHNNGHFGSKLRHQTSVVPYSTANRSTYINSL